MYRNTDAPGDALALPFKSDVFDAVFCGAVLEHVPFVEKFRSRMVCRLLSWGIKFDLEKINFTAEEDHVLAGAVYFRGTKNGEE